MKRKRKDLEHVVGSRHGSGMQRRQLQQPASLRRPAQFFATRFRNPTLLNNHNHLSSDVIGLYGIPLNLYASARDCFNMALRYFFTQPTAIHWRSGNSFADQTSGVETIRLSHMEAVFEKGPSKS